MKHKEENIMIESETKNHAECESKQDCYELLWRNKFLTIEAKTIDDMIQSLQSAVDELQTMKEVGVTLDETGGTADDYARLITTDPSVAEKFGFEMEEWDWDDEDEDDPVEE